ncbi:MAG: hypothetical protein ABJA76_21305 [Mucilaginibacter sp.]
MEAFAGLGATAAGLLSTATALGSAFALGAATGAGFAAGALGSAFTLGLATFAGFATFTGFSAFAGLANFFANCLAAFSISFSIFFEVWPSFVANAFNSFIKPSLMLFFSVDFASLVTAIGFSFFIVYGLLQK